MRVIVSGSAGFLGSWIAESLVKEGHTVFAVDDLSGGLLENVPKGATFLKLDLSDRAALFTEDFAWDVDMLVHLAANAREGASFFQPGSVVARNTLAFANTMAACLNGGRLKRVVLYSSISVYGKGQPPFLEETPPAPCDIYGIQKAAMERMLIGMAEVYGLAYVIIRPQNVFGPRQMLFDKKRNVLALWANRIMRGEPLVIFGDGQQQRAFSYIEDSLPCYLRAILGTTVDNQIVNIGGQVPIKIIDLLYLVEKSMGYSTDYPVIYLPDRPNEVKYAFGNHDKAISLLGYEENIGLEEGICRMAKWALSKGPQEWREGDPLEINSELIPSVWR